MAIIQIFVSDTSEKLVTVALAVTVEVEVSVSVSPQRVSANESWAKIMNCQEEHGG